MTPVTPPPPSVHAANFKLNHHVNHSTFLLPHYGLAQQAQTVNQGGDLGERREGGSRGARQGRYRRNVGGSL